ncbi:MAG TPA: hypothetical protein VNA25_29470 [Phycisphaerae bacterium]|nr:hypothetical protein [Phycisphaerae bacterium]HUT61988.1 hypothetical protein [Phycisphaerae bacterium]
MTRKSWALLIVAALALLAGCDQAAPGRIRLLGEVNEELAFTAAQDVMAMYFQIENVNADTRQINCQPKPVQQYKERLVGGSPTRHVARLQLIRSEGQLAAQVAVAIQQQGSETFTAVRGTDKYDSVPNQTPSEIDAATTAEQNQTWKTVGYAYSLERKILDDLFRKLHPEMSK